MGKKKERLRKLPDFNKRIISHSVDSMTKDAIEKIKKEHPNMRENVITKLIGFLWWLIN